MPETRSLPSVEMITLTTPLKTNSEVLVLYTLALPLMIMGDSKAALKPLLEGSAWMATY